MPRLIELVLRWIASLRKAPRGTRRRFLLGASALALMAACAQEVDMQAEDAIAELPSFPWPPPQPSSSLTLSPSRFAGDETFGDVNNRIIAALEAGGYAQYSYYRVPGGFAIVARLERIRDDARAEPEPNRFLEPSEQERSNPLAFLHNLFFAPEGYYRQVVFLTSNVAVTETAPPPTAEEAAALLESGAETFPLSYRQMKMEAGHRVTALIYEFRKRGEADAAVQRPGGWNAATHLERSGLLAALPRGG